MEIYAPYKVRTVTSARQKPSCIQIKVSDGHWAITDNADRITKTHKWHHKVTVTKTNIVTIVTTTISTLRTEQQQFT